MFSIRTIKDDNSEATDNNNYFNMFSDIQFGIQNVLVHRK